MPDLSTFLLFVGASLAMQMMPGPATLYIATRSLEQGVAAGLASALGIIVGAFFHVLAAMLGVSALLMVSASAFAVVKYAGAAYLIYLGVQTLRRPEKSLSGSLSGEANSLAAPALSPCAVQSLLPLFRQGVMVNVLNPKVAIFFLAFLPQFIAPDNGPAWIQNLLLGTVFALLGLLTGAIYVLLASRLRVWFQRYRRFRQANRYISGSMYIALGMTTAVSARR